MTTQIKDLVDISYACQIASSTQYPLTYKFDSTKGISAFTELLWWEEESSNEFDLDEQQYSDLIEPWVSANWDVIKTYISFSKYH